MPEISIVICFKKSNEAVDRIGDMMIEGDLNSSEIENDILTATGIISED